MAMNLIFVDVEAHGGSVSTGRMTEFGAVSYARWLAWKKGEAEGDMMSFHGLVDPEREALRGRKAFPPKLEFQRFEAWLDVQMLGRRPIFVSDNPAYDWQWINDGFHVHLGHNPFGWSARRIGDFYAGLVNDFSKASVWKALRETVHDHHPVNDALGNCEAFRAMQEGRRVTRARPQAST